MMPAKALKFEVKAIKKMTAGLKVAPDWQTLQVVKDSHSVQLLLHLTQVLVSEL